MNNLSRRTLQEREPEDYFSLNFKSQKVASSLIMGSFPVVAINNPFGTGKTHLMLTSIAAKTARGIAAKHAEFRN